MSEAVRERKNYIKSYYYKRNAYLYHLINYVEELENFNNNK